jgi:hypothetical protein
VFIVAEAALALSTGEAAPMHILQAFPSIGFSDFKHYFAHFGQKWTPEEIEHYLGHAVLYVIRMA